MAKGEGTDYDLYVSESAPADLTTTSGYSKVGFATEQSLTNGKDLIESADKDTGDDQTYELGRRSQTIEGTFHLDRNYQNDAGQNILWKNYQGNTANDRIWVLLTNAKTGDQQYYGKAVVEDLEVTFPDQNMAEITTTLQIHDGITRDAN